MEQQGGAELPQFQFAWLRALAYACGPDNDLVTAVDAARALPHVERVRGRVTGQAAAANLTRLGERGLAEAVWEQGRKRWRITDTGRSVLEGSMRITDTPQPKPSAVPPEFDESLVRRLADVIAAYNQQDLSAIDRVLSPDVLIFVPGFNALAGTYAGHGQVIHMIDRAARHFLPDVEVLDGAEEGAEARVRVRARALSREGGVEAVELWIRVRFGPGGLIVEGVVQPDDQTAFDRAVGAA
jgi:ketosteroid isomerase-like protein